MKSLRQRIRDWLFREDNDAFDKPSRLISGSVSSESDDDGLTIQVRSAIGGRIVSFRHYDNKLDRRYNKTYIVPEDQDFERELGRMITLESMR
jgi:hypothetical protein